MICACQTLSCCVSQLSLHHRYHLLERKGLVWGLSQCLLVGAVFSLICSFEPNALLAALVGTDLGLPHAGFLDIQSCR